MRGLQLGEDPGMTRNDISDSKQPWNAASPYRVLIGLGSNMGCRLSSMARALHLLSKTAGCRVLAVSRIYLTAPVGGPPGQPPYINAVLLAEPPAADPMALLLALQDLEAHFGRQRLVPWGPRSLDLDLLWCGTHRCESAALWLPHPRWQERTFVLAPLAVLAPELLHTLAALESGAVAPERLAPRPGWPE